jgi:hypothetical protein
MHWEYMEETVRGLLGVDRLNDRGSQGWELCAAIPNPDQSLRLIFKREKPEHP